MLGRGLALVGHQTFSTTPGMTDGVEVLYPLGIGTCRPLRRSQPVTYALSTIVEQAYPATLTQVRDALAAQGFGVLTEIDLQATPTSPRR